MWDMVHGRHDGAHTWMARRGMRTHVHGAAGASTHVRGATGTRRYGGGATRKPVRGAWDAHPNKFTHAGSCGRGNLAARPPTPLSTTTPRPQCPHSVAKVEDRKPAVRREEGLPVPSPPPLPSPNCPARQPLLERERERGEGSAWAWVGTWVHGEHGHGRGHGQGHEHEQGMDMGMTWTRAKARDRSTRAHGAAR